MRNYCNSYHPRRRGGSVKTWRSKFKAEYHTEESQTPYSVANRMEQQTLGGLGILGKEVCKDVGG